MAKVPALFLSEVDRAMEMSVLCAECVCYKTYCSSFCPRRVLAFAVRMRCASAAAGMHASMLSLVALEMHKAMRPAQLRRLQAERVCVCHAAYTQATRLPPPRWVSSKATSATSPRNSESAKDRQTAAQTDSRTNGLQPPRQRNRVPVVCRNVSA